MQAAPGEDGAQGDRRASLKAVLVGPGRELGGERRPWAMVRAEADRGKLPAGVEVTVADFDDPASIAAALREGRTGLPGHPDVMHFARDYAQAFTA